MTLGSSLTKHEQRSSPTSSNVPPWSPLSRPSLAVAAERRPVLTASARDGLCACSRGGRKPAAQSNKRNELVEKLRLHPGQRLENRLRVAMRMLRWKSEVADM